ncbi:MAG: type II toxin-antitoxin system VapC family toxin [Deltaproteobacteria bacterium]|nr:type II toxin-antitoxin system VapC family toxin [Deltaproteobacteria bacterium]
MASPIAIVDSCVYIELFRHGHFRERLEELPRLVRHSAVVLSELRRGATERRELRWIDELEANARVFSPGVREWRRSGEILAALRRARTYDSQGLRDLHFDALIALTARAVGAVVITCNGDDFADIRRYEDFDLEVWPAPARSPVPPPPSGARRKGARPRSS